MTDSCRRVREDLAAGEATAGGHVAGCPACATFARDVERLRVQATGLPRPLCPANRRSRVQRSASGGRRALLALATAASLAITIGLLLRSGSLTTPPSRALDAAVAAAGSEERLDLLGTLAAARRVYTPAGGEGSWLALPRADEGRPMVIDPLATLRAAALLVDDEAQQPRRRR